MAFTASNVLTKKPKTGMRVVKGNWDESDDESNRRNSVEVSGDDTDGDEAEMVGVCIGRHKSGSPTPSREKLPPKWPPETSGASVPAWQRRLNLPSNNRCSAFHVSLLLPQSVIWPQLATASLPDTLFLNSLEPLIVPQLLTLSLCQFNCGTD